MSDTRVYYATFEVSGSFGWTDVDPSDSMNEILRDVFSEYINKDEPVVETNQGDWYFGKVEPDADLYFGKFGKVFSDEPTIYDEEEGDFVESGSETTEADYSVFVLDINNKLIAYTTTYRVRHRNFIKYFKQGFDTWSSGNLEIKLELLKNDEELEHVLASYPIYEIDAELTPSNPGAEDSWKELDDSMQEMLVNKLGIKAERFEEEGINVSEDFISQVTAMSQSEYGESWKVKYIGETNQLKVISSDDEEVIKTEDDDIETVGDMVARSGDILNYAYSFLN